MFSENDNAIDVPWKAKMAEGRRKIKLGMLPVFYMYLIETKNIKKLGVFVMYSGHLVLLEQRSKHQYWSTFQKHGLV